MRGVMARTGIGLLVAIVATGAASAGVEADAAFEQLKTLQGTWSGRSVGEGEAEGHAEPPAGVKHEFRVSAAGSVVMETMQPGTDHEMINMYHLDGDELVLTHFCAAGNQPTMRLDRANSTADHLVFEFTGGTNLDPAVDHHIHAAELSFEANGTLESAWASYVNGKPAGMMTFFLTRAREDG